MHITIKLLTAYLFLTILSILLCINPAISDELRKPAWFFVHTDKANSENVVVVNMTLGGS